jgi:hypothetical protein
MIPYSWMNEPLPKVNVDVDATFGRIITTIKDVDIRYKDGLFYAVRGQRLEMTATVKDRDRLRRFFR